MASQIQAAEHTLQFQHPAKEENETPSHERELKDSVIDPEEANSDQLTKTLVIPQANQEIVPENTMSLGDGIAFEDMDSNNQEQHPLECSWTLWYMNGDHKSHAYQAMTSTEAWSTNLVKLSTFSTVEAFWQVMNHIAQPSKLRVKNDYMLFREGIKPQWEDEANKKGGSWKLLLPSKYRGQHLDRIWMETLLSLVGENYDGEGEQINGCYLQRRQKEDRIAIWTSNSDQVESLMTIGRKFKEYAFIERTNINFAPHEDQGNHGDNSQRRHSSWKHRNNNVKFYV